MFTGIIQKKSRIISVEKRGTSLLVHIEKPASWKLKKGVSVAVDGICSTVRAFGTTYFEVEYMPETLAKTTAADLTKGDVVNLERSLRLHAAVDGHFVQGHVDARGTVTSVRMRGSSKELAIRAPRATGRFIALHGSVTINGVSLTVARIKNFVFTIALVPFTRKHTNLDALEVGDCVNIETDLIARYLAVSKGK